MSSEREYYRMKYNRAQEWARSYRYAQGGGVGRSQ